MRIHQKIEDPRFLYWCDQLGLMVWGEIANAYEYSPQAVDRLTREWLSAVKRDRSHPSIVTWVPINESWGVSDIALRRDQQDFATSLYYLTKAIDPTRPVISNEGWEHTISDIWGIHDYTQFAHHSPSATAPPRRSPRRSPRCARRASACCCAPKTGAASR